MTEKSFYSIKEYLTKVPAMHNMIYSGLDEEGYWWIKFSIDITHPLAWNVVQELAHVINYLSDEERLPTVFYPVSSAPYLNGGPDEFLHWVIETDNLHFRPSALKRFLEDKLPQPVEDETQWAN